MGLHITSDAWISIGMPCSTQAGMTVDDAELVELEHLFETASHGDTTFPGADDEHGVVSVSFLARVAYMANSIHRVSHIDLVAAGGSQKRIQ